MENRIRAGILIFDDGKLLLVKHVDPEDGYTWWVAPGGRVEEDETIFECAERETLEETTLKVKAGRVVYLCQYIDRRAGINSIEVYLTCESSKGSPRCGVSCYEVADIGFFPRQETAGMNLLPKKLKDTVWLDYDEGFPAIRFLGIRHDEECGGG
jgi:8-oxo-dGTP pyrophosphatase MutT (NUDIX family)